MTIIFFLVIPLLLQVCFVTSMSLPQGTCQVYEHERIAHFNLPKEPSNCQFPFVINGTTHNKCVDDDDEDEGTWCSTKTDPATNEHVTGRGHWGLCNDADLCPLEFGTLTFPDDDTDPQWKPRGKKEFNLKPRKSWRIL